MILGENPLFLETPRCLFRSSLHRYRVRSQKTPRGRTGRTSSQLKMDLQERFSEHGILHALEQLLADMPRAVGKPEKRQMKQPPGCFCKIQRISKEKTPWGYIFLVRVRLKRYVRCGSFFLVIPRRFQTLAFLFVTYMGKARGLKETK